ncbi:unnamed protein product [Chrysoparadoxa australica]
MVEKIRSLLLPIINSSTNFGAVRSFQSLCGVTEAGLPTFPVLHAFFSLASSCGEENFFVLALPTVLWVIGDGSLARAFILFFCSTFYVGGLAKDLLRLPRPSCPPAIRMESHYSAEYGLPSTHVMGSLLPLFLTLYYHGGWAATPLRHLGFCFFWTLSIALSRLYLGVHSLPDLAAGVLLGGALLQPCLASHCLDNFLLSNPLGTPAVLLLAALLLGIYPRPPHWTPSVGDTAVAVGSTTGVLLGLKFGQNQDTGVYAALEQSVWLRTSKRLEAGYSLNDLGADARRCCFGLALLLAIRSFAKPALRKMLRMAFRVPPEREDKDYRVDVPSKLVTYGLLGFAGAYTTPLIWWHLNWMQ